MIIYYSIYNNNYRLFTKYYQNIFKLFNIKTNTIDSQINGVY